MALRTVALCDGKYIGIETVYTVINGKQVNIPEKIKELREKSRSNSLFCPCGCGSNLILVAGDKNLKEQHFRLKNGAENMDCHAVTEGMTSINSKIVLKCWLDLKLGADDLETRVPVYAVGDTARKYEYTFLSREKNAALSYCHDRANLSDEKLDLLEENGRDIKIIYVLNSSNGGNHGQYPEGLMKIQKRQGFCLFIDVEDCDYSRACMSAVFYEKSHAGFWNENIFASGKIDEFDLDTDGSITFHGEKVFNLLKSAENELRENLNRKLSEEKEKRRRLDEEMKLRQMMPDEIKHMPVFKNIEDDNTFGKAITHEMICSDVPLIDYRGRHWIQCELCGKISVDSDFATYGGLGKTNTGICRECLDSNPKVKEHNEAVLDEMKRQSESPVCPVCGGPLVLREGKFGKFWGCTNYPDCGYTRKVK